MDPDVTLRQVRDTLAEVRRLTLEDTDRDDLFQAAEDAVNAFTDLDEWLTQRHGFLPRDWAHQANLVAEVQQELDAHPTWRRPTQDEVREAQDACSFPTLAGTTSWDQRCVDERLSRRRS